MPLKERTLVCSERERKRKNGGERKRPKTVKQHAYYFRFFAMMFKHFDISIPC